MVATDDYWAGFFGVPTAALGAAGLHVVPHAGLDGYGGAWVYRRGQATIISVPRIFQIQVQQKIGGGPLPESTDALAWGRVFGRSITRVIGPAYDGFAPSAPRTTQRFTVRPLAPVDALLLASLKASCTDEEWDHASINPDSGETIFGCVVDNGLAGVAQNERRTPQAVSSGVVAAPDRRRRGVGASVLSAAIHHGISSGRLVLYQTLMDNAASVRLGESLGVVSYAHHFAYRFAATGSAG